MPPARRRARALAPDAGVGAPAGAPAAAPPQRSLLDLLDADVLDHVLAHLDLDDLCSSLPLTCRRLNAAVAASQTAWKSLRVETLLEAEAAERTRAFAAWLDRRGGAVEKLEFFVAGVGVPQDDAAGAGAEVWAALLPALGRVAPTLRALSLQLHSPVEVGAWALRLTALRSLTVRAEEVTVSARLEALTRLTTLAVRSTTGVAAFSPRASLPPALAHFQFSSALPCALPAGLAAAAALRNCSLAGSRVTGGLAPLACAALGGLRQLALNDCGLTRAPVELGALTGLVALYLDGNDFSHSSAELGALVAPLARLRVLALSACRLGGLPDALMRLALRALYVEDNPLAAAPEGPALAGLLALSLDWGALLRSPGALARAARLRRLFACRTPTRLEAWTLEHPGLEGAGGLARGVEALVEAVRAHPSLRSVTFVSYERAGGADPRRAPYLDAMLRIARGCPRLEAVDAIEESKFFAWGVEDVRREAAAAGLGEDAGEAGGAAQFPDDI